MPVMSAPALAMWKPSTSLAGEIASMTFCASMCAGNGSCTRMPWMVGSALSASTRASSAASVMVAGQRSSTECMPVSSQALTLLRTYTCDAAFSPTRITARPGVMPRAFRAVTRAVTSARSWRERALPSMSCAVMG
ncbi:hypothetical protein FQZ97_985720 [compost metagenome]